jgi:hypothetical protein
LKFSAETAFDLLFDDTDGMILSCKQSSICQVDDVIGNIEENLFFQRADLPLDRREAALDNKLHKSLVNY